MNPPLDKFPPIKGRLNLVDDLARRLSAIGSFNLVLFGVWIGLTPLLTLAPGLAVLHTAPARLAVFTLSVLGGGFFLRSWQWKRRAEPGSLGACLAAAALAAALVHIVTSYSQEVSTYPLTMGWSETSRYYYASLFFSERIYGISTPPTVLHPSRYLLQAIPFFIPETPLWLHRLWQAFLWVALPGAAAYVLARRLVPERLSAGLLIAGAAFGYLMIGPVYYHLLVPVILVTAGFSTHPHKAHWLRNAAVILAASAWAGISRVNWFPVPGLLAATLIFLERPIAGESLDSKAARGRQELRYLLEPAVWTLTGTAAAFLAQIGYIAWSGNSAEQFTTSFASDLLWSRLLPNPTYPPGILLGIVLVSLPVGFIVAGRLLRMPAVHWLRLAGLAAILGVLLAGGLVVSVKIGGGSNLHNLDAYLVVLTVVGAYFATGRAAPEGHAPERRMTDRAAALSSLGAALSILVIASFTVGPRGQAEALPEQSQAQSGAQTIIEAAEDASRNGGQVLFLSNRHLLTFADAKNVALVPEYERVFLMEAAMANDPAYLGRFYNDLENRRFALIVSEPLSRQQKGAEDMFGAENDAWVKRVARYVLCYYEPVKTLRAVKVQLLVPRQAPDESCR